MRVHHVRGVEEAERFDDAFGGGITELFSVTVHVNGGEGATRVLREDPRLSPVGELPLGLQDVRHEVGGEEERVLLSGGKIDPRLAGSSLGSATNSAEPPSNKAA